MSSNYLKWSRAGTPYCTKIPSNKSLKEGCSRGPGSSLQVSKQGNKETGKKGGKARNGEGTGTKWMFRARIRALAFSKNPQAVPAEGHG